jgi:hypothetical protein
MKPDFITKLRKRKKLTSVLGLALDGSRLEGVVLKRTNGSLQKLQRFSATLALDPLTAAPELVGREIRNHLDAAGVRERDCVLGLPLKWVLTAQTELPAGLPEADAASLLQLEAEKGFHADAVTLQIGDSRSAFADDKKYVLLAGIPNAHLGTLEQVLAAAKLRPASFALAINVLPASRRQVKLDAGSSSQGLESGCEDALTLLVGENSVGLQVTAGGVVALRSLDGGVENEAGQPVPNANVIARETRITLGQLPPELRGAVKRIRIFGPRELAQPLADELELKFEPLGFEVEVVSAYAPNEFGVTLPVDASVSAAFSLAASFLVERKPAFEFLPPKQTVLEQLVKKYSSGKFGTAGAVAAGVTAIVLGIFLVQQIQLWSLRSQWSRIQGKVSQLQATQDNIRQYRSWYDGSFKKLSILRQLSLAFPEDGSVTAKNIEIRDTAVTCSGTARDYASLLAMQAKLRAAAGVGGVRLEQVRGKAPMQFVFGFTYNNAGGAQ